MTGDFLRGFEAQRGTRGWVLEVEFISRAFLCLTHFVQRMRWKVLGSFKSQESWWKLLNNEHRRRGLRWLPDASLRRNLSRLPAKGPRGSRVDVYPLPNVRTGFCWEPLAPMTGTEPC